MSFYYVDVIMDQWVDRGRSEEVSHNLTWDVTWSHKIVKLSIPEIPLCILENKASL